MAGSINKVTLVGGLGKDPEVRNTQSGLKIVNLNVATSDSWTDRASGERKQNTEWHRVVIMNDRLAETAEKYLRKGSKVYLEGKLQTRKWTDQSGQERHTTEILLGKFGAEMVLLDRNPSRGGADEDRSTSSAADYATASGGAGPRAPRRDTNFDSPDLDDEIPF